MSSSHNIFDNTESFISFLRETNPAADDKVKKSNSHPDNKTLYHYVNGDLDDNKTSAIMVHIANCERCAKEVSWIMKKNQQLDDKLLKMANQVSVYQQFKDFISKKFFSHSVPYLEFELTKSVRFPQSVKFAFATILMVIIFLSFCFNYINNFFNQNETVSTALRNESSENSNELLNYDEKYDNNAPVFNNLVDGAHDIGKSLTQTEPVEGEVKLTILDRQYLARGSKPEIQYYNDPDSDSYGKPDKHKNKNLKIEVAYEKSHGRDYNDSIQATGSSLPYNFSISDQELPEGIQFSPTAEDSVHVSWNIAGCPKSNFDIFRNNNFTRNTKHISLPWEKPPNYLAFAPTGYSNINIQFAAGLCAERQSLYKDIENNECPDVFIKEASKDNLFFKLGKWCFLMKIVFLSKPEIPKNFITEQIDILHWFQNELTKSKEISKDDQDYIEKKFSTVEKLFNSWTDDNVSTSRLKSKIADEFSKIINHLSPKY
jgi:hypothetical protein